MIQSDILIEPDLQIENGDIKVGPSDDNNTLYIVFAHKGQLRANTSLGVGVTDYTNAPETRGRDLSRSIRLEHQRDGYKVGQLVLRRDQDGNQTLSIKAVKVRI